MWRLGTEETGFELAMVVLAWSAWSAFGMGAEVLPLRANQKNVSVYMTFPRHLHQRERSAILRKNTSHSKLMVPQMLLAQ